MRQRFDYVRGYGKVHSPVCLVYGGIGTLYNRSALEASLF